MTSFHEVTAIFGGAFDPPHWGHREAVAGLFAYPGVKRALVIPTGQPVLKPGLTAAHHRLAMAQLCFRQEFGLPPLPSEIEILETEIARASRDGKPSYAIDTLAELTPQYSRLAWVIGTDQLADLPRWHRFNDLLEACDWIVLERAQDPARARALEALKAWEGSGLIRSAPSEGTRLWTTARRGRQLLLCPTEARAGSSTKIRETLGRTGEPPADSLIPSVEAYLKHSRLYGTHPTKVNG